MNPLIRLLLNTIAIMIVAYLLPGVYVGSFWVALIVALLLGLVNVTLKPILVILTLPLTIMSLGLFLLVINAVLIQLVSWVVDDFGVTNFWWAVLFSILLTILNSFLQRMAKPGQNHNRTTYLR